jgi:hypothetical protein
LAALAALIETSAENRMEKRILSDPSLDLPARTDVDERVKQSSFLAPEPPLGQTRAASQSSPTSILAETSATQHPAMTGFSAGIRKIDGVVAEILRDSVIIHCTIPSGTFDLRLPPALVPTELMSFGSPVSISLETTGGGSDNSR